MANESSKKKSETEKTLTTSKAFKGIENVIEKVVDKLPSNVQVDGTKLVQMALGGTAAYVLSEPMLKQAVVAYAQFLQLGEAPALGGMGGMFGVFGIMIETFLSGGVGITEEEQEKIDAYELSDEERLAFACGIAALTPMVPDIVKGLGEVVKGIGEVVPG